MRPYFCENFPFVSSRALVYAQVPFDGIRAGVRRGAGGRGGDHEVTRLNDGVLRYRRCSTRVPGFPSRCRRRRGSTWSGSAAEPSGAVEFVGPGQDPAGRRRARHAADPAAPALPPLPCRRWPSARHRCRRPWPRRRLAATSRARLPPLPAVAPALPLPLRRRCRRRPAPRRRSNNQRGPAAREPTLVYSAHVNVITHAAITWTMTAGDGGTAGGVNSRHGSISSVRVITSSMTSSAVDHARNFR